MIDRFIDIHCHILPGIDDGPTAWDESLAMARIAADDGIESIVATPHQLGGYDHNRAATIVERAGQLQRLLDLEGVPIEILPGADVRIEPRLASMVQSRAVLTLAGAGRHLLLELPHELYFPLEPVLEELARIGVTGILTHPERNQGILRTPRLVEGLVARGCLMQITAGSLTGAFGEASRGLAEWMVRQSLVHFVATDAHGPKRRRPLMRRAYDHVVRLAGEEAAALVCRDNPEAVIDGHALQQGRLRTDRWNPLAWLRSRRKAG